MNAFIWKTDLFSIVVALLKSAFLLQEDRSKLSKLITFKPRKTIFTQLEGHLKLHLQSLKLVSCIVKSFI